uniref:Terminal uridylyltransferase 4 n=1 Tax=Cacopsylla melanoneura TaxID=428564 RepID=A0A8D9F5G1_9HEMI
MAEWETWGDEKDNDGSSTASAEQGSSSFRARNNQTNFNNRNENRNNSNRSQNTYRSPEPTGNWKERNFNPPSNSDNRNKNAYDGRKNNNHPTSFSNQDRNPQYNDSRGRQQGRDHFNNPHGNQNKNSNPRFGQNDFRKDNHYSPDRNRYQSRSDNKMNEPSHKGFYADRSFHGSDNRDYGRNKNDNKPPHFGNKPPPLMSQSGRSKSFVKPNKENTRGPRRDSEDSPKSGQNIWHKANKGDLDNKIGIRKSTEAKDVQFMDPPILHINENKSFENNDFEDYQSSKLSSASKSESVTSSDQHEVEMKILNLIHDFKTTLHLVEIKPSIHVQTEIKGLQKYIGLILDKWNPKSQKEVSSSDSSDSSDSDSFDESNKRKKKKKRNKKRKNKNKEKNKEDVSKADENKETSNAGNHKSQQVNESGVKDGNVSQFQESAAPFLNQTMFVQGPPLLRFPNMPMMPPPPSQYMPLHNVQYLSGPPIQPLNPVFGFHNNQINGRTPPPRPFAQPAGPQPTNNSTTGQSVESKNDFTQDVQTPSKIFAKPGTNSSSSKMMYSESKTKPTPKKTGTPKNLFSASTDASLRTSVKSILNDIRASEVTMSKTQIKEIREALDELTNLDSDDLSITDLGMDFKNINMCMIKVVDNETVSHDVKDFIMGLLEELSKEICEEKNHNEVEKLINVYKSALEEMKNKTNNVDILQSEEAFEQFRNISGDANKLNELCKFQDNAKDLMNCHNESMVVTVDTSKEIASETDEESNDMSSEDENPNSDEGSDGEKKEEKAWKKRKRAPIKLDAALSVHCQSFLSSKEQIEEQVDHLLSAFKKLLTPEYKNVERKLLYQIKDVVKVMYPTCVMHLFGSRVTNMALPDSDMDMYIDVTGQSYTNSTTYDSQQLFVKKIKKIFYRHNHIFSNILGLTRTTVPIIKVHHKISAVNCDISFKNGISIENTKLLCYYLSIDPRVKWLLTAVKLWANYNHIAASDFFTSHALNWLALFYLMRLNIAPPVKLLQKDEPLRIIDNWNIAFKKLKDWTPATETDVKRSSHVFMLTGFFRFLTEEDFESNMACTYTGNFIPKKIFQDVKLLGTLENGVFEEYADRIRIHEQNEKNGKSSKSNQSSKPMDMLTDQLCVQDPFEFSKNVSNPVKGSKFDHFMTLSTLTYKTLCSPYSNCSSV